MKSASAFERPLLIYDDKCDACGKFARTANKLSRGWIRIAGHHYSEEARIAKQKIFPQGYDSTGMFWLVNKNGAHGARSGLIPLAIEILRGIFLKIKGRHAGADLFKDCHLTLDTALQSSERASCEYTENHEMKCHTGINITKRLAKMLRNQGYFPLKS